MTADEFDAILDCLLFKNADLVCVGRADESKEDVVFALEEEEEEDSRGQQRARACTERAENIERVFSSKFFFSFLE